MPKNYKNDIESFTVDYRDKNTIESKSGVTKPVVGRSVAIKKERKTNRDQKSIGEQKSYGRSTSRSIRTGTGDDERVKYDVYINAKPKRSYRGIMVVMTIVLTAIGIGIFASTLNKTTMMTAETVSYNSFNGFLYPVVMQDPQEFTAPENADKGMVVSSSIWMTIFRNKAESYNSFDEQGYALIPVAEIKESCEALFGDGGLIDFSKTIHGPFYYYNPGEENMHIGAISNQGRPLPQIRDAKEEENEITFTVDYVLLGDPQDEQSARDVVKTMIYNMHLNEQTDKYYIYSAKKAD